MLSNAVDWSHKLVIVVVFGSFLPMLLTASAEAEEVAGDKAPPLPLAASWNVGKYKPGEGYNPDWQVQMIAEGHHIFLTIGMDGPEAQLTDRYAEYCKNALQKAAEQKLPICMRSTQWEASLYRLDKYHDLPEDDNPCWVDIDGKIQKAISPFGPKKWWRQLGKEWTDSPLVREMQKWYPDPPYIVVLSNNEARDLRWHQAEQSKRYMQQYGAGRSDEFKRKVFGDGYTERYQALLEGMREGLAGWADKAIFIGYNGAIFHIGRWDGWKKYSLTIPGRISITPFAWDGCSPSYYVNGWQGNSDHKGYSPQVAGMNLVYQKQWAQSVNPDYFWELSTWFDPKWIRKMEEAGQSFPPERYRGYITWGMWMTKPRVIRHFTGWTTLRGDDWHRYRQIVEAVDQIHNNPTLAEFWQHGRLVPNPTRLHPYQSDVPQELQDTPRWYALKTSLDPPVPHDVTPGAIMGLVFKVWIQAQVLGEKPDRRWLIYAHSPLGPEQGVEINIPDYGTVKADVTQGGSYYLVTEKDGLIHPNTMGTHK